MNQIQFACPYCGKVIKVKAEAAGKHGKCSGCNQEITIPQASEPWAAGVSQDTKNNPSPQSSATPSSEKTEEILPITNPSEDVEFSEAVRELIEERNQRKAREEAKQQRFQTGYGGVFPRIIGGLVLAIGVVTECVACQTDASVNGVYNLGLLTQKQIAANVGIGMTVVGILLIIMGEITNPKNWRLYSDNYLFPKTTITSFFE